MLFTPSPPLSSQSVSSSVESDFSPAHTVSICKARNVENHQHRTISFSNNTILVSNGPSNEEVLSSTTATAATTLSLVLSVSNEEDFYQSPLSSSNLLHPSTRVETSRKQSHTRIYRRNSCPYSPFSKASPRFNSSTRPTVFLRNVLMATMPMPDRTNLHTEDKNSFSKDNLWSNNNIMPVANPIAAAALVHNDDDDDDDDGKNPTTNLNTEPFTKSSASSPLNSRKSSLERVDHSTTVYSGIPTIHGSRKVLLNVGGVRHESNNPLISIRNKIYMCVFRLSI